MTKPFDIPELLEAILVELPVEDLILATSVNKTWRAAVCGSIKIRKRLLTWRNLTPEEAMAQLGSSASRPNHASLMTMITSPQIHHKMRLFHIDHPEATFIVLRRHKTEVTLLLPTDIRKARILVLPRQLKKVTRVVTWNKKTGYTNRTALWHVKWYREGGLFVGNRSYSNGPFARYFQKFYQHAPVARASKPPEVMRNVLDRASGR